MPKYQCVGGPMHDHIEKTIKLSKGNIHHFRNLLEACDEQYEFRSGKLHYLGQANFRCQLCDRRGGPPKIWNYRRNICINLQERPPYKRLCQYCRATLNRN